MADGASEALQKVYELETKLLDLLSAPNLGFQNTSGNVQSTTPVPESRPAEVLDKSVTRDDEATKFRKGRVRASATRNEDKNANQRGGFGLRLPKLGPSASVHPAPDETSSSTSAKMAFENNKSARAPQTGKVDEISGATTTLGTGRRKSLVPASERSLAAKMSQLDSQQDDPGAKKGVADSILRAIPLIYPDSTFRMQWDFMILLLVIYYGLAVPTRIAFDELVCPYEDIPVTFSSVLEVVAAIIFVVDIFLNFRTAVKIRGVMVTDSKTIALEYLKFWFVIDLIAILPVDKLYSGDQDANSVKSVNKILRLLRVFKLFRVFRISRILSRVEDFTKFNPSFLRLFKIFFLLIIAWHWIACTYWFLSDYEDFGILLNHYSECAPPHAIPRASALSTPTDPSGFEGWVNESMSMTDSYTVGSGFNRESGNMWVPPPELWCQSPSQCNETLLDIYASENGYNPFRGITYCFEMGHCPASFSLQYIHSFFWAVMITTGIGRDIMPVTFMEHMFSTSMIVVGVLMYAVIIGSASSALANLDSGNAEKRQKMEAIKQYMRQRHVPRDLQKRIREYYEYMWSSHQSLNEKEGGIISDMHHTLRLELHIALNRKLIQNIPMFKAISDSDCLIDLIEKLEPRICIPGEFICLEGDMGRDMYIIVRGKVQVLIGPEKMIVATLKDGDVFGEQALITRTKRNASIRSLTYVESLVLSKSGFETVLHRYPQFFRSLQIVATKGKGGWASVRATLKMAKSIRLFGGEIDLKGLLLGSMKDE